MSPYSRAHLASRPIGSRLAINDVPTNGSPRGPGGLPALAGLPAVAGPAVPGFPTAATFVRTSAFVPNPARVGSVPGAAMRRTPSTQNSPQSYANFPPSPHVAPAY